MHQDRKALRVKTIAKALGVSTHTVYREIQNGHLASYRVGGTIRVSRAAFADYLSVRGIPAEDLAVAL
jgi:excisionase family DNA binding protein